jgi:NADH dehydrogenase [ubiquinone] 1 alpha subcomplex assembly factor 5
MWVEDATCLTLVPPVRIQASPSTLLSHPQISPLRDSVDAIVSAGGLHWVGDIVGRY